MRNPQNGLNFKRGTIAIKLVEILHLEQCDRLVKKLPMRSLTQIRDGHRVEITPKSLQPTEPKSSWLFVKCIS